MSVTWYEERPESEAVHSGTLVPRDSVASPGGRTRLLFQIDTGDAVIDVYSPVHEPGLAELAGGEVVLVGKLVDLSDEGFGLELWLNPEVVPRRPTS